MTRSTGRVAVLLPSVELGTYWGPVLQCLDASSEGARIFTAQGWPQLEEDPLSPLVHVISWRRRIIAQDPSLAYGGGMMLLPLRVVYPLLRFRPRTVAVMGFSLWTILVLLLRPLRRWTVVLMWEGSSPGVDHRASRWRTRLRSVLAHRADRVLTSNRRSEQYLRDHLGVPAEAISVHPLLVPSPDALTAGESTAPLLEGVSGPVVLAVGRLEPRKGLAPLLRAMAALPDVPVTLAIIGRGDQEADLRALAAELGISDRVRWLGWVAYPDLGAYLRRADLLAFPTLEDTWGMVAPEAMSLGTPTACSVHAGASEVITDGVDGALIDPEDLPAMTDRLRALLTTTDLAAMGAAARSRAAVLTPQSTADAILGRAGAAGPAAV